MFRILAAMCMQGSITWPVVDWTLMGAASGWCVGVTAAAGSCGRSASGAARSWAYLAKGSGLANSILSRDPLQLQPLYCDIESLSAVSTCSSVACGLTAKPMACTVVMQRPTALSFAGSRSTKPKLRPVAVEGSALELDSSQAATVPKGAKRCDS